MTKSERDDFIILIESYGKENFKLGLCFGETYMDSSLEFKTYEDRVKIIRSQILNFIENLK